jgi:hypothetical protein
MSLVMRCKAGTNLRRALSVTDRARRRSGHRPRSPTTASPGLGRLTPSVLPPPDHIPSAGASGSRRRQQRGGGRRRGLGVEERIGVFILDAVGADAAGAVGLVGGRGVVEGAKSGGLG